MQVEDTQPLKPTRSSFIRGLPESMPVDEVIERGREIGLSIQPSDVHSVRYYMRQAAASAAKPSPVGTRLWLRPNPGAAPTESTATPALPKPVVEVAERAQPELRRRPRKPRATAESMPKPAEASLDQLRVLVLQLGFERTRTIMAELESMATSLAARRPRSSRASR